MEYAVAAEVVMARWKVVVGVLGIGLVGLGAAAGGGWWWVRARVVSAETRTWQVHAADHPLPPPLTADELAALGPDEDPMAVATARSAARGKYLVEARYACGECHGADFGGGRMIEDPVMGTILGPNLTTGAGSATRAYTAADWDRKVRHGVAPSGRSGPMPSEDYQRMSDQELGDIVTYVRSLPPVDRAVPPPAWGPLGAVLVATGKFRFGVERMPQVDHHEVLPPPTADTVEFGRHVLGVCTGCHRANFEGGPIVGGPPDWAPAANLTPHADGLAGWTREDFVKVMRTGVRPDGTPVRMPMAMILPYAARAQEVELHAMWTALQAAAPAPDGT